MDGTPATEFVHRVLGRLRLCRLRFGVDQWARRVCRLAVLAACVVIPGCGDEPSEPRLVGRAIESVRASAPAPFPAREGASPRPAPGARQPVGGSPPCSTPRAGTCISPWRTTASAPGTTQTRSCSGSIAYGFDSRPARRRRRRPDPRLDRAARPRPQGALPHREPEHEVAPADGRRLRHRVVPSRFGGTLWFGDEFGPFLVHTEHDGQGPRATHPAPGCNYARHAVAVRPRPVGEDRTLARLRSDGHLTRRPVPCIRRSREPCPGTIPRLGGSTSSTSLVGATRTRSGRTACRTAATSSPIWQRSASTWSPSSGTISRERRRVTSASSWPSSDEQTATVRWSSGRSSISSTSPILTGSRRRLGTATSHRRPLQNAVYEHRSGVADERPPRRGRQRHEPRELHGRNRGRPDDSDFVVVSAPDLP